MDPAPLLLGALNDRHPHLRGRRVRPYLLRQSVWFDTLYIPDAHFNNNAAVRHLVWAGEQGEFPALPRDLDTLLRAGVLRPVLRGTARSLAEVREAQIRNGVRHGPSEAFVDAMEALLPPGLPTFDLAAVSREYKQRALRFFAALRDDAGSGVPAALRNGAYAYIERQDVLYYDPFKDWLHAEQAQGRCGDAAFARLDALMGEAYRPNVGIVLGTNLDEVVQAEASSPRFDTPEGMAGALAGGRAVEEIPAAALLCESILVDLPAGVVLAARELPSRARAVRALEGVRAGVPQQAAEVVGAVAAYLEETNRLLLGSELPAPLRATVRAFVADGRATVETFSDGRVAGVKIFNPEPQLIRTMDAAVTPMERFVAPLERGFATYRAPGGADGALRAEA